jgi:ribonuclease P protein component
VLAAADRLRHRDDFAATIKSGGRAARGSVVVHVNASTSEYLDDPARAVRSRPATRAGFVVSKAVGGAVVRNKVKRRLRHLIRTHLMDLPVGTDVVVRALPTASARSYVELERDVAQALAAAIRRPGRSRQ